MSVDNADTSRAYHHGDLRRGLIEAAQRLLEAQGADALSLRAVAREAGVSPAAPYHHFKDKNELLDAVARRGWVMLSEQVASARGADGLIGLGMAYVSFARNNIAIYQLMYTRIRGQDSLPHGKGGEAYDLVKKQVRQHIGQPPRGWTSNWPPSPSGAWRTAWRKCAAFRGWAILRARSAAKTPSCARCSSI